MSNPGNGTQGQDKMVASHVLTPWSPGLLCLTAPSHGRALMAGRHHPVRDLARDGAHSPHSPAALTGGSSQGQVGQCQPLAYEQSRTVRALPSKWGLEGGPPPYPGESPQCCLHPRFLPLRGSPRRAPLATDSGLSAAQHLGQPLPLLPSPLLQRYLEHLLLPSLPQLGYEDALLNPYSYHKVSGG